MPPTATKRPVPPTVPEPTSEPIHGNTIVVIHPGSYNLRLGRASDAYPYTIPHCIARRRKSSDKSIKYEDRWLSRPEQYHESSYQQKQALKVAAETVRLRPTSTGEYRQPTSHKQLAEYNNQVSAEESQVPSHIHWTNTDIKPPYIIGEEVLYLRQSDPYNIHWPVRRSRLNLHSGPGGSLTAVLQDLETIWGSAIQTYLDIPLRDLKHYRAVLLVPDIYQRHQVKELMNLLLNRLGFGSAFVHQESVCATFGAGVSSACVVDVGDQKTSVSCVEDGLSQKNTRLCMEYGGSDVTRCFYWLLTRAGFPYKDCRIEDRLDSLFLQDLKENLCHLDQDTFGVLDQHFQLKRPDRHIVKYSLKIGDETLLAPMTLFYPDMFGLRGNHLCRVQQKSSSDPEDPFDDAYLLQTQSKQEAAARLVAAKKRENAEAANQNQETLSNVDESQINQSQLDEEDTMDQSESVASGDVSAVGSTNKPSKKYEEEEEIVPPKGLLGLDQAILHSIDKCDSDDMKRRMYSCIVVVGGGLMLRGAQSWLQYMVWTQMPAQFRLTLETMDVITCPKDFDPRLTCWKGAAVLCCLDSAQELWIHQREWNHSGVKLLRERAPFVW